METVSDGCPTGILIDFGLQTKILNNTMNENEKNQVQIKKKNMVADGKALHSKTLDCILDQSPQRTPPNLQINKFLTPKSNWKSPSPRSMKIISHEASRIIDQLYSSPINCSEGMINDEVFPVVKSLDGACLDEYHIKSRKLSETETTCTQDKIGQCNPNSLDFAKCTISDISSSEISDEKLPIVSQCDMKPVDSGKIIEFYTPKNAPSEESCAECFESDKEKVKSVCVLNSSPVITESTLVSGGKLFAPQHKVTTHKKIHEDAKVLGFKTHLKHYSKENVLQFDGIRQTKYGRKCSKTDKSYSSIEDGSKEAKITKNQILRDETIMTQSSKKRATAKYPDREKIKGNQKLEDPLSQTIIGKPGGLWQKSNTRRSQSVLYKNDPLCKTMPLLGTGSIASSVQRTNSFHFGNSRNTVQTVEKEIIPSTDSCSRVLKPKISLNQVSNNGNEYATPLQFTRYSQSFKPSGLSDTKLMQKKSCAYNFNCSSVVSHIKVAQNDQHSNAIEPTRTASSKLRFVKKLNASSFNPKFKKDSLPRKLFP